MFSSPPSIEFQLVPLDLQAPMSKGSVKPLSLWGRVVVGLFGLMMGGAFLLPPLLVLRRPRPYYPASGSSLTSLLGVALPLVFFAFFWFVIVRSSKGKAATLPRFNQPTRVSLEDEALVNTCGDYFYSVKWPSVERTEVGKTHLLLWTTANEALVVPRRAFESDDDFVRFCDFARGKCEAAKPVVPPIAAV